MDPSKTSSADRLPTLYLPHGGGPCFFMDWDPPDTWDAMAEWLRGISDTLPQTPRALLVISAHWEEPVPTVTSGESPPLLFDYFGFPPHTYELTWPAPGAPELARRVGTLVDGGVHDEQRGFDHGVFIPLKLTYPDAQIPTVQLSLRAGLDPEFHLEMGRVLAPLRDEGVFIIGSGMSYHNMRMFMQPDALEPSRVFDSWLEETAALPPAQRDERLAQWTSAPHARACHPREEHLLPLMVCAGAGGADTGRAVFTDEVMGVRVSAVQFGGVGSAKSGPSGKTTRSA